MIKHYRTLLLVFALFCNTVVIQAQNVSLKLNNVTVKEAIEAVKNGAKELEAYVVKDGQLHAFTLKLGEMTPEEREIILKGCLINYNRV